MSRDHSILLVRATYI